MTLLAEALSERSEAQARLESLRERLMSVARVQEGDVPDEDPAVLLAERDGLLRLRRLYAEVAKVAGTRQDRYSRTEIKFVSTLPVAELRAQADTYAQAYRELDTRIQQLNWNTPLVE